MIHFYENSLFHWRKGGVCWNWDCRSARHGDWAKLGNLSKERLTSGLFRFKIGKVMKDCAEVSFLIAP